MTAYFLSDIHLGAPYFPDSREAERRVVAFLDGIKKDADVIYLLGDILDYWYEYRYVVPRGFVRFFGKLAELADMGIRIIWFIGNHDIWIFDYLPNEIGLTVADGVVRREIDGRVFVMEHGDGVGEPRRLYRMMRSLFRNRIAQKLYAAIHPRWTVGFAHRWSRHSRLNAPAGPETRDLPADDPMISFAENYMQQHGHADFFIFGHRHMIVDRRIAPETRLVVLGDAFRHMTYGVWDGANFTLEHMKSHAGSVD